MSTCWYFHRFPLDRFRQVFGAANKKQESKLLKLINDPDEGFEDEEEGEEATEIAREMLKSGISYANKSEPQKALLDQVVIRAFNRLGLAKELGVVPMSPEAVTLKLAGELTREAKRSGASLIDILSDGRRFGTTERPALGLGYFILMPEEIRQLKAELETLLADTSATWRFPDVAEVTRTNIIAVLDKVAANAENGFYAVLT